MNGLNMKKSMYKWETDGILFVSDSNAKILYQYFINLYDKEKTILFKNNNHYAKLYQAPVDFFVGSNSQSHWLLTNFFRINSVFFF